MKFTLIAVAALLLLSGCGSEDLQLNETPILPPEETLPAEDKQTTLPAPSQEDTGQTTPEAPPPAAGLERLVAEAKQDLAQRLSVSVDQISLIQAEEVVWPDASLGCPQPGVMYIQILVEGALIVLQKDGINYPYHSGSNGELFLCENDGELPTRPPKINPTKHIPPLPD